MAEQYVLERTYSFPLDRWKMETGLDKDPDVPDEELVTAYAEVVAKHVKTRRSEFGDWMSVKADILEEVTDSTQIEFLEQALRQNDFEVEMVDFKAVDPATGEMEATYEVQVTSEGKEFSKYVPWVLGGIAAAAVGVVFWNSRK